VPLAMLWVHLFILQSWQRSFIHETLQEIPLGEAEQAAIEEGVSA
jgi:hypothetical protein